MEIIRPIGPVNILLVDDKPANLLVLQTVLQGSPDYILVTASSGPQALELVKRTDFAAIYTEDPYILKGYEVGAIDYISKPFNPDILKAKVDIYANLYIKSRQSA